MEAEVYQRDVNYERQQFSMESLEKGEYENCTFHACDFTALDLSSFKFVDCIFQSCNLSLCDIRHTALRDLHFKDCKLMGLRFDQANSFGLSLAFETCVLDHSVFFGMKLKNTVFRNSRLHEVDFSESDLTAAIFENCDLQRAIFMQCNLQKADFRTSYNYAFDPEVNRIKKAKFSLLGVPGLLYKYDIHIDQS